MPRRLLLTIAAVALATGLGAGCADDVSPAARLGDETLTHDELMDEVAQWSESPALVGALTQGAQPSSGPNYDMALVTVVLTNRILFDTFGQEFDRRDLELDPALVEQIRGSLFPDQALTAQVMDELDSEFADQLVDDIAKQVTVQDDLGEDIDQFVEEAFADIEVSSRYGRWDAAAGSVVGPSGPQAPLGESVEP